VLDRRLRPLPPGCRGELLIGGLGLARGYLGQPDLTARSFIDLDLGHGPRRFYRTGDIASWDEDGLLRLHGRRDSQIKLRGLRIEPAEIESRIRECPEVAGCAVVPFERDGQRGLAAFLVARPGVTVEPATVRRHLVEVLPGYMVPAFLLAVAELPLLPSGKTDPRTLLAQLEEYIADRRTAEAEGTVRETAGPVMEAVTLAMQAILRHPVGPDASFFDQGGDSLGAARVLALLRKALGVPLHMSDFVAAPSVRALALRLEGIPGTVTAATAALAVLTEGTGGLARGLLVGGGQR
jgi:acyl carrier protein